MASWLKVAEGTWIFVFTAAIVRASCRNRFPGEFVLDSYRSHVGASFVKRLEEGIPEPASS